MTQQNAGSVVRALPRFACRIDPVMAIALMEGRDLWAKARQQDAMSQKPLIRKRLAYQTYLGRCAGKAMNQQG